MLHQSAEASAVVLMLMRTMDAIMTAPELVAREPDIRLPWSAAWLRCIALAQLSAGRTNPGPLPLEAATARLVNAGGVGCRGLGAHRQGDHRIDRLADFIVTGHLDHRTVGILAQVRTRSPLTRSA